MGIILHDKGKKVAKGGHPAGLASALAGHEKGPEGQRLSPSRSFFYGHEQSMVESKGTSFVTCHPHMRPPVNPSDMECNQEAIRDTALERRLALGELARVMGHDFNNLLQGVLGALSVVKLSTPATHQLYSILDLAERNAHQARELGRRLIYLAKGNLPLKQAAPLGPLFKAAVEVGLRGTSITCQYDLPEGLEVKHDEQAIRILVDVLVANAKDAMPKGGTLTVSAQAWRLAADDPSGLPEGAYVRHTFRDSGPGIAAEVLPRIFEAYFTTKDPKTQKGVGLSLAIAEAIAWSHGGSLSAEGRPGQGAAFHLLLPALNPA